MKPMTGGVSHQRLTGFSTKNRRAHQALCDRNVRSICLQWCCVRPSVAEVIGHDQLTTEDGAAATMHRLGGKRSTILWNVMIFIRCCRFYTYCYDFFFYASIISIIMIIVILLTSTVVYLYYVYVHILIYIYTYVHISCSWFPTFAHPQLFLRLALAVHAMHIVIWVASNLRALEKVSLLLGVDPEKMLIAVIAVINNILVSVSGTARIEKRSLDFETLIPVIGHT